MGGASFDISVVQNGRVTLESERYPNVCPAEPLIDIKFSINK
jgi:hypothetical protein